MTNKAISIFNQLRPLSVGFDDVFDHFESMFDGPSLSVGSNYPPYNIVKTGKHTYDVEVALAGYGKKDIDVEVADGIITVKSIKENSEDEDIVHRGISYRKFEKRFSIADDIQIKGAKLENGLLTIDLEREIPDEKKPRLIAIH